MPIPADTPYFQPRDQVERFNAATSIHRVFATLGEKRKSGFIMEQDGRPVVYVDASELGAAVGRAARGRSRLPRFGRRPVADFVKILPESAVIRIERTPVTADQLETRTAANPGSGFVVTDGGKTVGWYLRREWFSGTHTRRVRFICDNNHVNYDPDSTYRCRTCSLRLRRVEQE